MSIDIKPWLFFYLIVAAVLFCATSATAKKSCNSTDDCPFYKKPICVLDKKKICFRWFTSPCHMDIHACQHNKGIYLGLFRNPCGFNYFSFRKLFDENVYEIYHDSYCDLDNFMCDDEFDNYEERYEENENLDKIIYSIYS